MGTNGADVSIYANASTDHRSVCNYAYTSVHTQRHRHHVSVEYNALLIYRHIT